METTRAGLESSSQKTCSSSSFTCQCMATCSSASVSPSLMESYVPSSLRIIVLLLVHSKDLWPRPPHVKHLKELFLMVSSVGVDDDEALGLKLLVVGERLGVVEVFL